MSLVKYKKKRNFKNTPEPVSGKGKKSKALTFVIQRHDATRLHYDFRLEIEGVLKSWAVPKGPSMVAGEKRLAMEVEDHPLEYGKFYGKIPEGNYGAGDVEIWDHGTYEPMKETDNPEKELLAELKKGDLKIIVHGNYLNGVFALVRMKNAEGNSWLLIKKSDEHSVKKYDIEKIIPLKSKIRNKAGAIDETKAMKPEHIKTRGHAPLPKTKNPAAKTSREATKKKEGITTAWTQLKKPMLALLSDKAVDSSDWLYEMKYDGYRAVTMIDKGKVEMVSRNGNSFNKQYASLIKELSKIKAQVILDGEVVIEDKKGVSNFQLLQNYSTTQEGTLKYYVFDILYLNGHSIIGLTLDQRKELLQTFFDSYNFKNIYNSPFVVEKGNQLFGKLAGKGYEGIIAKKRDSTYHPGGRRDSWLKIKHVRMQEAIICGHTSPQRSRKYIGSLILGIYQNEKLVYVGNCGTGFTDASLKELHGKLSKLETNVCPFETPPKFYGQKGKPTWIKPKLICHVKFLEWTADNHFRNPVFMGLRTDLDPKQVGKEVEMKTTPKKKNATTKTSAKASVKKSKTAETKTPAKKNKASSSKSRDEILKIGGKEVKVTNLDKIYWPEDGISKSDLINYYRSIKNYILPYLKNRPLSLLRHPNGIHGESFYQKDMETKQLPSWTKTAKIYSKSNKKYIDYFICNDEASLVYIANLGSIEINPWHSYFNMPDNPTYMMLDLDPADIGFEAVVDTALAIKKICDKAGIATYPKTSGATGLHVYIPLGGKYDDEQVKAFAELLAGIVHDAVPEFTSIERMTAKRKDKVYIDFLQNRKGQTLASAYSVRPRPRATVSAPLLWKEVNHKLTPQMFTIHNLQTRLNKVGDLWKDVLTKSVHIKQALPRLERL